MPIEVSPDVAEHLQVEETLYLQVRSAADPDRLARALAAAAGDIARLGDEDGSPAFVSEPIPTPDGPMLLLDLADTSEDLLATIPEILVQRLSEAGVTDAVLRAPQHSSDYDTVHGWAPAVRCWLRGPDLFDVAHRWLVDQVPQNADWSQVNGPITTAIRPQDAPPAAAALLRAGCEATILATHHATGRAISVLGLPFPGPPKAALSCAGERRSEADTVADLHRLREHVRAHAAGLSWAGITVEPDARDLTTCEWNDRTRSRLVDPGLVPDLLVPDGMWCQLLTTGHLQRLGGPPPGAVELADGLVELTVGEAEQWLPGHPDQETVLARARHLLSACLATPDRVHALSRERLDRAR